MLLLHQKNLKEAIRVKGISIFLNGVFTFNLTYTLIQGFQKTNFFNPLYF